MIPENLKSSKSYFQNCYRMWILILLRLLKGMSQFKVLGPALLELTIRGMGPDIRESLVALLKDFLLYVYIHPIQRPIKGAIKLQIYIPTCRQGTCLPKHSYCCFRCRWYTSWSSADSPVLLHIQYHSPALHKYFRSTSVSEMVIHI